MRPHRVLHCPTFSSHHLLYIYAKRLNMMDTSQLSPSLHPRILRSSSSSKSLNGMEIAARSLSPRTETSKKTASYHSAKPLPPTPSLQVPSTGSSRASSRASSRTNSTVSSIYTEDVPPTPKYAPFRKESLLPPRPCPDLPKHRSSMSTVPDPPSSRPKPKRDAKTQDVLQKPATVKKGPPESIFSEWRAPKYEDSNVDDPLRAPVPVKVLARKSREAGHVAQQHAADYMSVLPRESKLLGPDPDTHYIAYNPVSTPTTMSPRITDVVDESLIPHPLRLSSSEDSNAFGRLSVSSLSDLRAHIGEIGVSPTSGGTGVFHSRNLSLGRNKKERTDSGTSTKQTNVEERSNIVSMTPSQRGSIQRGIIEMYDTLTSLYDPLNKYGPPTKLASPPKINRSDQASSQKNISHADFGNVASPFIQDKDHGGDNAQAATGSPPASSHHSSGGESWFAGSSPYASPKQSHFSQSSITSSVQGSHSSVSSIERKIMKGYTSPPTDAGSRKTSSVGGKIKKVVGLEGKKGKMTEREKRRDDMKKRIVVVGTIAQGPFG